LLIILISISLMPPGSGQQMGKMSSVPNKDRFPSGTLMVVSDDVHHRIYFATKDTLYEKRSGLKFTLPDGSENPESISFSLDGRKLILRCDYDAFVLQTSNLHLVRHLDTSSVWWEGSRLGYLAERNRLYFNGALHRASDPQTDILGADPDGKRFLGARKISRGTEQDGYVPRYRLRLGRRTERGTIRWLQDLGDVSFDPGSSATGPHRLFSLGSHTVFGYPNVIDQDDVVSVRLSDRVTAPLKDRKGNALRFLRSPVIAGNDIVGLAESQSATYVLTGDRYLYRVTGDRIELHPVPTNLVLITYDAKRHRIAYGIEEDNGVSLEYWVAGYFPDPRG
jgi:hypothetical protein